MIQRNKFIAFLLFFVPLLVRAEEKFTLKSPHLASALAIDVATGREILSVAADEERIPASTLKIVTAVSALRQFGSEFSFTTEFFLDRGVLIVKGGGDPALVREDLWIIASKLREKGLKDIDKLCVDDSLYASSTTSRSGDRAYYAGAAPLSVDYNANDIANGDEAVYRSVGDPALNFTELFIKILAQVGIRTKQQGLKCIMSGKGEPLYSFKSKPLRQILDLMNTYSTNMIAESLLYLIGRTDDEWSRAKGLRIMQNTLSSKGSKIVDGSGLSRENKLTARDLVTLLISAYKDHNFNLEFIGSLPVGRKRGTLKGRSSIPKNAVVRAKTGSLDGVITLAGYIVTGSGKTVAFSVLQNEVREISRAYKVEEDVLSYLFDNF